MPGPWCGQSGGQGDYHEVHRARCYAARDPGHALPGPFSAGYPELGKRLPGFPEALFKCFEDYIFKEDACGYSGYAARHGMGTVNSQWGFAKATMGMVQGRLTNNQQPESHHAIYGGFIGFGNVMNCAQYCGVDQCCKCKADFLNCVDAATTSPGTAPP